MSVTRRNRLLLSGVLITPVFIGLSLYDAAVSPGFSIVKHQVSLLLIGPQHGLQTANFVVTGLLGIASAAGLRTALRGGRGALAAPLLFAAYGLLMIVAGLAPPDPQLGFPPGAPDTVPAPPSASAATHATAFSLLALAVVVAGLVLGRRFSGAGERGWRIYSLANSGTIVALVVLGGALTPRGSGGLPLLGVALCISVWISTTSFHLSRLPAREDDLRPPPPLADRSAV